MSYRLVRAVLGGSKSKGCARLVLVVLAEHADESGIAWPSVTTLAAEANIARSSVFAALTELLQLGEIVPAGIGRHGVRRYRLAVADPSDDGTRPDSGPVQILDSRGPDSGLKGSDPRTRTVKEPSRNRKALVRDDVRQLCERLADRMVANGCKRPDCDSKDWQDAARLLLDRDRRPLDAALALIDWCQADKFWRGNVLSMPTFRKQYDQLRLKADAGGGAMTQSYERTDISAYERFDQTPHEEKKA